VEIVGDDASLNVASCLSSFRFSADGIRRARHRRRRDMLQTSGHKSPSKSALIKRKTVQLLSKS
jgi:hypothetical protein